MSSPTVFSNSVVDYICNPNDSSFCKDISEMPDKQVKPEDQALWWGILGILISGISGAIAGGDGFALEGNLGALGWEIMNIFGSGLWGPSILLWIVRLFV